MATQLGNGAKPTSTQEWTGLNSLNQQAVALTLPGGGPWDIVTLGGWLAGKTSAVTAYLCIWDAAGNLIGQSASFSATGHAYALGNCDNYERAVVTPPSVAGGATVYVGWSRDPAGAAQWGRYASGSHRDDTQTGGYPGSLSGFTTDSGGAISGYLYYQTTTAPNSRPTAPTLNSPVGYALVASQTPTLNFTPHDPDGDTMTNYEYWVSSDGSYASGNEDHYGVAGSYPDGVAVNRAVIATLVRGTTYASRVRAADAGGWGPYSSNGLFKIASLPTASVAAPVSVQTAELYFTPGASGNPKIKARWSYSCPDGHAQSQIVVKIYADSAGSVGSLLSTDTYNGTAASFNTTYAVVEGSYYHVSVTPTCSLGVQGAESTKKRCRTRWARASYYFDSGSTPVTLGVSVDATVNPTSAIVLEYAATTSTTEPTTWYSSISAAGLKRYFWHRATMFAWGSATPTSPKLNSVTWTYSALALTLDFWTVASGASVDVGTYVYGRQSLKHDTNGGQQRSYATVPVTANTDIILSGRIKTLGQPNAELRIEDGSGTVLADGSGTFLASAVATADTDWTRYATSVINTGSATSVRAVMFTSATAGATAWFDAIKVEASTVVTPWAPGFVSGAMTMDAGGMAVDASKGGVFRLKGSAGGTGNVASLGPHGLILGTSGFSSGAAFPSSPSTNERFFRTDLGMDFYYDGTRWLSQDLIAIPFVNDNVLLPATATFALHGSPAIAGAYGGMYITHLSVSLNVAATHSAASYWTVVLQDGVASTIFTAQTSWSTSAAAAVWGISIGTPNYVWGNSLAANVATSTMRVLVSKVGTPGPIEIMAVAYARLIAT